MNRVVFVDDDAPVLEGLRVRLHPWHGKWEMTFLENGAHAIAAFQRQPFDLIVSDIRMPGVHGARLLRTVAERWPGAVRVALSGVTDPQETLHVIPIAHQFLSKPCAPGTLEKVIERCLSFRSLLPEPRMRTLVGRMRRLAPERGTFSKLQSLLSEAQPCISRIAQLISSDTVIAAKVMHVAHSAFFRQSRSPSSIDDAVDYLGVENIQRLISSTDVFSQSRKKPAATSFNLEQLQAHTLRVARVTRALSRESPWAADAHLAAILHDFGYWLLAQECPRELDRAHALALERHVSLEDAERETLGASHAQIGAYLLGLWGLAPSVIAAVAHHHAPQEICQSGFDAVAAVVIAHALADAGDTTAFQGQVPASTCVDAEYLERLGAPFGWDEAARRAAQCLQSPEEFASALKPY
jgi:HD-like signal output (HDOD) protein